MLLKSSFLLTITIVFSTVIQAESITYTKPESWKNLNYKILALQKRKFTKKNKWPTSIGLGYTMTGAFTDSFNGQIKTSYFYKETQGWEFLFSYNNWSENTTAKTVRDTGVVPFRRAINWYLFVNHVWAPYYGKLAISTENILNYDFALHAGIGLLSVESNSKDATTGLESNKSELRPAINIGPNLIFIVSKNYFLRLDFDFIHYMASKEDIYNSTSETSIEKNYDITIAIGKSF